MTIDQLTLQTRKSLSSTYSAREADWMTRLIMEDITGKSRLDLLVDGDKEISDTRVRIVGGYVDRLLAHEPLQYILGYETFMGIRFKVTPDVLIPRPETQELVELVSDREGSRPDLSVLDAGTGSGCIAITLSRYLLFPHITAIDVSPAALDVARENARLLRVQSVTFVEADMTKLNIGLQGAPFDIIVSNPPYVMDREKAEMDENVLNHEPAKALFVSDNDPLVFYRALTDFGRRGGLKLGGRIYFEANPLTVGQLASEMNADGWNNIEVLPDSSAKPRFLCASL